VVRVPAYRSSGTGFASRRYQIFWEVVGLGRGPLSLVITIEELLGRNSSCSGLENRQYGRGDPLCWRHNTLYPKKLALTSPKSGGCSVGIVRLRTKATEFVCLFVCLFVCSLTSLPNIPPSYSFTHPYTRTSFLLCHNPFVHSPFCSSSIQSSPVSVYSSTYGSIYTDVVLLCCQKFTHLLICSPILEFFFLFISASVT
jgi:hypothetical protein